MQVEKFGTNSNVSNKLSLCNLPQKKTTFCTNLFHIGSRCTRFTYRLSQQSKIFWHLRGLRSLHSASILKHKGSDLCIKCFKIVPCNMALYRTVQHDLYSMTQHCCVKYRTVKHCLCTVTQQIMCLHWEGVNEALEIQKVRGVPHNLNFPFVFKTA